MADKESAEDWNKCTVPQLKGELRRRGLSVKGRKADLVNRLSKFEKSKCSTSLCIANYL